MVGREFNQKLAPFMNGHLDEMKEKTKEVNGLFRSHFGSRAHILPLFSVW